MSKSALFDKIDQSLIRVLHTVITECSVSRAAIRLQSSQPAVSAQLRRLRDDDLPEGGFGWHLIRSLARDLAYVRRQDLNTFSFRVDASQ